MVEHSCVYKFNCRVQRELRNGVSINEVLNYVDIYQRVVRKVYGRYSFSEGPLHKIITSKIGLSSLTWYEYARYRGLPLPNSNTIIESLVPFMQSRREYLGGKKTSPNSQDSINF